MAELGSRFIWVIVIVTLIAIFYRGEQFDPESIRGKRVLITGASSGIGEELAYQYSRLGASVLVTARRAELLEQVVVKCRKLGAKQAEYVVGDMARRKDRARIVDETKARLGGLDHLILNHAIINIHVWKNSVENVTTLQRMMEVNFLSYVDIASRSTDMLVESNGSIGVVSSMAGKVPSAYETYYNAPKFALSGFFLGWRQELYCRNIDVSITIFMLGYIGTETSLLRQKVDFPEFPMEPEKVNETALVIIKGVQNRDVEVYFPVSIWHYTNFYSLAPRLADILSNYLVGELHVTQKTPIE